jgi:hypothetical protein
MMNFFDYMAINHPALLTWFPVLSGCVGVMGLVYEYLKEKGYDRESRTR